MRTFLNSLVGALAALACLASASFAQTTDRSPSLTVDDILGLESIERADLSPDGRWLVYEKRGAYDSLPSVEFGGRSVWTIMDLWLVDLRSDAPPTRLLPNEGLGLQRVAWSPDGERLLITRLQGDRFEYGIVTLRDRAVRWIGLTPDMPPNGAFAEWAAHDTLVLLASEDGRLPASLRYDRDMTARRSSAWATTARGREPARTVIEARHGVLSPETPSPHNVLVRLNALTGERKTLMQGRVADFAVAPDGTSVAVTWKGDAVPLSEPELVQLENESRLRLSIIDLDAERNVTSFAGLDVAPHLMRWSPDARAVLVWARQDGERWRDGALWSLSAQKTTRFNLANLVVGTSAEVTAGVKAEWIGSSPVIQARTPDSERRDWHRLSSDGTPAILTAELRVPPGRISASTGTAAYVFADGGYWEMTAQGVRPLAVGDAVVREAVQAGDIYRPRRQKMNEPPRRPWSVGLDENDEGVVISADGRVLSAPFGPIGEDRVLALSRDRAVVLRRVGLAENLIVQTGLGSRQLDVVNAGLAGIDLPTPKAVSHLDIHGRPVTSWLFLPDGADIKGVIVKVYPGWADNLVWADPWTMTYSTRPAVFVAAGYAYLSPFLPADQPAAGRGEAFEKGVDLAIDAALKAEPQLPRDRLVLWGHSFGGYATLEIATRSERFRGYIASSSYSDMQGVWGEFDPGARIMPEDGGLFRLNQGWTETTQAALGAPPWVKPDDYAASSPFLRADRIRAPVLFLTADMDFTPATQAERMFSAILRTGGEARMVTYWGEQHLLWSPANIRDYYGQIFGWLERVLRGTETVTPSAPVSLPRTEPNLRSSPS